MGVILATKMVVYNDLSTGMMIPFPGFRVFQFHKPQFIYFMVPVPFRQSTTGWNLDDLDANLDGNLPTVWRSLKLILLGFPAQSKNGAIRKSQGVGPVTEWLRCTPSEMMSPSTSRVWTDQYKRGGTGNTTRLTRWVSIAKRHKIRSFMVHLWMNVDCRWL